MWECFTGPSTRALSGKQALPFVPKRDLHSCFFFFMFLIFGVQCRPVDERTGSPSRNCSRRRNGRFGVFAQRKGRRIWLFPNIWLIVFSHAVQELRLHTELEEAELELKSC
jgi:hypothetical protein